MKKVVSIKRKAYKVGSLDKRIIFQVRKVNAPGFQEAQYTIKFDDTIEVWGGVETINGTSFFNGKNVDENITHRITVRYRKDILELQWLKLAKNGTRLNIIDVNNVEERDEYLIFLCNEHGDSERPSSSF